MAKQKLKVEDNFLTFAGASESRGAITNKTDRDLAAELYKKNWQSNSIDSFEKSNGIVPRTEKPNLRYKNRVFTPGYDEDSKLLNDLMNNPKFSIIYSKDNWTVDGQYKMFVIYAENMDYKTPEELIKEITKV